MATKSKFIMQTRLVGPKGETVSWRDYTLPSGGPKLHDDLYSAIRSREGYARFCLHASECPDPEVQAIDGLMSLMKVKTETRIIKRTVEKTIDGNKIVKTVTDEIVEEASFVEQPVTKPVKDPT